MISFNPLRFNRCDWYIALWVIYYLQGIAYPQGGSLSLALLVLNLIISAYYAIKVMSWRCKPIYFRGLNILILMFTLYGVLYILKSPAVVVYHKSGIILTSYTYLKSIYLSLLPVYPFYYFSKRGYLTQEGLQKWGVIFLISVLLCYVQNQQQVLLQLMEKGSSREEITNNAGYLFLSCIPLIVVYRKTPLRQFLALAFIMAFIVMGMKRGAIAIGAITSAYFMILAIKNSKRKTKFVIVFLSLIIGIGIIYFFLYQMYNNEYMMQRVQDTLEGNSSGRGDLYSFFWKYFTEQADIIYCLFGRGANGTLEIYYNFAHNDWLEIAVNQGLFGIIIYAFYWYCFYRTWKMASNNEAKTIIAITILIFFSKTLFSMSYGDMTYVSTSVLGYALATVNEQNT